MTAALVGVLASQWQRVAENPDWAALVSLAWCLLTVFLYRVWVEVEQDAVDHTAGLLRAAPAAARDIIGRTFDWMKAAIARRSPGFRRRYLREMQMEHGQFNDRGLGLINAMRIDLEKVYVDLRASARVNLDRSPSMIGPVREGTHSVWRYLRDLERDGSRALAIVGAPGSGKTTLLKHVLLTLVRNRQRKHRVRARLPVLLELRHVHREITKFKKKVPDLEEVLDRHFQDARTYPGLGGKVPAGWFRRQLQRGGCLILLDGLDEVADPQKRRAVSNWIGAQLRRDIGTKNVFVVTSRPQGYRTAPLDRAVVLEVQPFSRRQVTAFIRAWYHASEVVSSGRMDNDKVRRRAEKDSSDLLGRLQITPSLLDLTANPLLLTMIAMVHRYSGALPGSRVQLYESVCKALLEGWRQAKGVEEDLTGDQKLTVLRPLARHMMDVELREIPHADALAVMTPALQLIGLERSRHDGFLAELQAGSGLILEMESGVWAFAHLSFQEYLTSADWLTTPPPVPAWQQWIGETWWRETLLLYAAQSDASGIVTACLDDAAPQSLALALDCERMSRTLQTDVRERLNATLHAALRSHDPDVFTPAAEAVLIRSQQDFVALDDGARQIGTRPVAQAEYQLFLLSDPDVIPFYRPPHWNDGWFPGLPDEPVLGMLPHRAVNYCQWLDGRFPAWQHRLPSAAELPASSEEQDWLAWHRGQSGDFTLSTPTESLRSQLSDLFSEDDLLDASAARARDRDLDLDRALALGRALDRALDRALARDRARALALDPDLDLAWSTATCLVRYVTGSSQDPDQETVFSYPDKCPSSAEARSWLEQLNGVSGIDERERRLLSLIRSLVGVVASETIDESLRSWRHYLMHVLRIVLEHEQSQDTMLHRAGSAIDRLRPSRRNQARWTEAIRAAQRELYTFLRVIDARERSELPAWEAILVVREPRDS
jgi:hypothetical protein